MIIIFYLINYLLSLIQKEDSKNIILFIKKKLSQYEIINKNFENVVFKAIKDSYFDYSLINLSLCENEKLNDYLEAKKNVQMLLQNFYFMVLK